MIRRILLYGFLTTGIQILLYIIFIYLGWTVGRLFHDPEKLSIIEVLEFGVIVKISILFFGIMLLLANLLSALINRRLWNKGLLFVLILLYLIGCGEYFAIWPWKTTLFLIAGLITIIFRSTIDIKIDQLINR
jgi:hypothetical protein